MHIWRRLLQVAHRSLLSSTRSHIRNNTRNSMRHPASKNAARIIIKSLTSLHIEANNSGSQTMSSVNSKLNRGAAQTQRVAQSLSDTMISRLTHHRLTARNLPLDERIEAVAGSSKPLTSICT